MNGESYTQRGAEPTFNSMTDQEDLQSIAHPRAHHQASSESESNAENAQASSSQCSSFFSNTSSTSPSAMPHATSVPSSASTSAVIIRSPTLKNPCDTIGSNLLASEFASRVSSAPTLDVQPVDVQHLCVSYGKKDHNSHSQKTSLSPSSNPISATHTFHLQPPPASKRKASAFAFCPEKSGAYSVPQKRDDGCYTPERQWVLDDRYDKRPAGKSGAFSASCYTNTSKAIDQSAQNVQLTRRSIKVRRSRSLPNLKAKQTMDLNSRSSHHLIPPPRLSSNRELRQGAQNYHHHNRLQHLRQHLHPHMTQTPPDPHLYSLTSSTNSPTLSNPRVSSDTPANASRNAFWALDGGSSKSMYIPSLHPPITRHTLRELDLHEILKNPQLRHDVVYDSNVQFRPNFDGERGRRKRELATKYWTAVQREIEWGCTCTTFSGRTIMPCICDPAQLRRPSSKADNVAAYSSSPSPVATVSRAPSTADSSRKGSKSSLNSMHSYRMHSRFPSLIQELWVICLSVLPSSGADGAVESDCKKNENSPLFTSLASGGESSNPAGPTKLSDIMKHSGEHHALIAQTLDPHFITQQLAHGTPDVSGIITFIGSILKQHCAPMRDELIENMISTVCSHGDVTKGLRMCFEILELMKLDIANHQLRSSRTYLVETAVDFETRWFREQMEGHASLERTSRWFLSSLEGISTSDGFTGKSIRDRVTLALDKGFLNLVFEPPSISLVSVPGRSASGQQMMSSTSLNHACTGVYPETFQFDAFRLLAFHGDVTDITIVYLLLLLFRQLACSPVNLSTKAFPDTPLSPSTIRENASKLALQQLDSVKAEVWTLLHEAEVELVAACRTKPQAPSTPTTPRTPLTPPGVAGRILGGSMWPGRAKFENSRWRRAVGDIVLQLAARAIQVQVQARTPLDPNLRPTNNFQLSDGFTPSEKTTSLLVQWLDTNLRTQSSLHTLCSDRLRTILSMHTTLESVNYVAGRSRKFPVPISGDDLPPNKRVRIQRPEGGPESCRQTQALRTSMASHTSLSQQIGDVTRQMNGSRAEEALAMEQATGLSPLSAEIRLLSERMLKVKILHLRVFRSVYERWALHNSEMSHHQGNNTKAKI